MKKKVSIKDIAEAVGVSTALVSYVLNNKHENRISREVAEKIRDTALRLNYRRNSIATSLKTSRSFTLGLVVADISNPFFSNLARIIEDVAARHGYTVIFGSSYESGEKTEKLVNVFLDRQVDGLILAPAGDSEALVKTLSGQETPFVLLDRYFPALSAHAVAIDNRNAARLATEYLIQNGYERIGMISYQTGLHNLLERERGFLETVGAAGVADKSVVKRVGMENRREAIAEAINGLLRGPAGSEAILFASNVLSSIGLKHINSLDLEVPRDLGVVSFDESDVAELFYAPLSYIRQPLGTMGETAVDLLLKQIGGESRPETILLPANLVEGKSVLLRK